MLLELFPRITQSSVVQSIKNPDPPIRRQIRLLHLWVTLPIPDDSRNRCCTIHHVHGGVSNRAFAHSRRARRPSYDLDNADHHGRVALVAFLVWLLGSQGIKRLVQRVLEDVDNHPPSMFRVIIGRYRISRVLGRYHEHRLERSETRAALIHAVLQGRMMSRALPRTDAGTGIALQELDRVVVRLDGRYPVETPTVPFEHSTTQRG
ncbi:hypothetical protein OF83DRAFT_1127339 [Amylostereum chailletii]|nr:hypothetical protein OF83DRAFT_1127339 [Amylostereum chailletii]